MKVMVDMVRAAWQERTGLNLEEVVYRAMMIRDVNNYIAVYEDGGTKRKGAYEWKVGWHQNAGGLVIPKVAEKVLVEGRTDPTDRDAMARHHGLHVAHQDTAQQLPGNRVG